MADGSADTALPSNGGDADPSTTAGLSRKNLEKQERKKLVLWKQPFLTLHGCLSEIKCLVFDQIINLRNHLRLLVHILLGVAFLVALEFIEGPHHKYTSYPKELLKGWIYWAFLGILSSVGLGTGLHTFVLFLSPFIAKVTMSATLCGSLNFPKPPYPDEILCPTSGPTGLAVSTFQILKKVQMEAFLWGLGTALGELPPYFLASRFAKMKDQEDEDVEEMTATLEKKDGEPQSFTSKVTHLTKNLIDKYGFIGIACAASIPNPFYDLAGIMCGYFNVPFLTFFGATVLGKAVIKAQIQTLFVIEIFKGHRLEWMVSLVRWVPYVGPALYSSFTHSMETMRVSLREGSDPSSPKRVNLFQLCTSLLIWVGVIVFLVTSINYLAQNYHKRMCKKEEEAQRKQD